MKIVFESNGGCDDSGRPIPAYGFLFDDIFITDPRASECGRFEVQYSYYGLTIEEAGRLIELNRALGVIRDRVPPLQD